MKTLNVKQVNKALNLLADVIMKRDGAALYDDENGYHRDAATATIQMQNIGRESLNDFLVYREKFEKSLAKQYKVNVITGIAALEFTTDHGAELQRCKVPQRMQIASGILDSLIGQLVDVG
tara:strand:+ start:551 stop:913 length:363 start_codon:yes stop_codon:yes gene_type:complete